MSSTTLPVCPKTGSTSPASQSIFAYTLLREIGNAPNRGESLTRDKSSGSLQLGWAAPGIKVA